MEVHARDVDSPANVATIDIRTIPIYILSPNADIPKYVYRRETVKFNLLASGFAEQNIHVVRGIFNPSDVVKSCSLGHAMVIEAALQAQLRNQVKTGSSLTFQPFLIFEDDVLPERNIESFTLHYLANADAVYPSMASDSADLKADEYVYTFDSTYITKLAPPFPFSDNPPMVRIYNMLTSHACLVLSLRWALNWLRCATEGAVRRCGFDVLLAYTMREYEVYGQTKPWFYQTEVVGGKEFETRLVLEGQPVNGIDEVPRTKMDCVASEIARAIEDNRDR